MDGEAGGLVPVGFTNHAQHRGVDTGGLGFTGSLIESLGVGAVNTGNRALVISGDQNRTGLNGVGLLERLFEAVMEVFLGGFQLFRGDVATTDEGFGVEGTNTPLCLNEVIHQRLRHRGVITLVVTAPAVADQVNDDIGFELLAVPKGNFCDPENSLGVIAVHVENRCLDGLCHIGGIDRSPGVVGEGGEPDLVVDDHVHGSTGPIGTELGHLQGFQHDALTGHGRISVNEDGENTEATDFFAVLFGANDSFEHAVNGFEV